MVRVRHTFVRIESKSQIKRWNEMENEPPTIFNAFLFYSYYSLTRISFHFRVSPFLSLSPSPLNSIINIFILTWSLQINGAGSFELEILEISNDKNHLIDGYCCGSNEKEKSKTVDCPKCTTAFRLCLKESSGGAESLGCPFGESTTKILGTSSFRLDGQRFANITVPFSFRWTVSIRLLLLNSPLTNDAHN